jgi:hypothetical protein
VRAYAVVWDGSVEDLPTAGYLIKSISGIYIEIVDFMASFGWVGSFADAARLHGGPGAVRGKELGEPR